MTGVLDGVDSLVGASADTNALTAGLAMHH
jgi:hypothetical protein